MDLEEQHSLGVFKPVGHVVVSFPSQEQAIRAVRALSTIGLVHQDVQYLSDRQMLEQADHDLDNASALAELGQEPNLARGQRELAQLGYHWLVVRARNDGRAAQIADTLKPVGAERAQYYGRFVIEELIENNQGTVPAATVPDHAPKARPALAREGAHARAARAARTLGDASMGNTTPTLGRHAGETPGQRCTGIENEDADPVGDGHADAEYAATQPPPHTPNPEPDVPTLPPPDPDEGPPDPQRPADAVPGG